MSGIADYMNRYPYTCLEQKISRAIVLGDEDLWQKLMAELPAYIDRDGLAKYFPTCRQGSDVLTAYLISITAEAARDIPSHPKKRMTEALYRFIQGKIIRHSLLPAADLSIRKISALAALSKIRNVEPRLLDSISIDPGLWPTSAVIDWLEILMKSPKIPGRDKKLRHAEQIIRSRLNFHGTRLGFSTENTDSLWWLMITPDVNTVRCILSLLDFDSWKEDIPRLVRGAIERQKGGRWNTTVANAWGVLALNKFSRKFEADPVRGISTAALAKEKKKITWSESPAGNGHVRLGRGTGGPQCFPSGCRQAMGYTSEPGGSSAQGTPVKRLPDKKNPYPC